MIKILKTNLIVIGIITGIYLIISIITRTTINITTLLNLMHIIAILLNIILLPVYIIKLLSTTKKNINIQYIDSKESIYTRDLPNEYNSVIAGELWDLKSKIQDEYVAGVIELISKGYIIETPDSLLVDNKKSTDKLLKNEKYILETINNIDVFFHIDYGFFKAIKEDMLDLGLYKKHNYFQKIMYYKKAHKDKNNSKSLTTFILLMFLGYLFIFRFGILLLLAIIAYIIIAITTRKNKLTEKGEKEKEKIGKLKLFLDRETNFKDKTKEERKLWGRYSAFAVALGVNKEIKNEIYEKIIKNK